MIGRAARRIGEMKRLQLSEKRRDVRQPFFGRAPEDGMLARIGNFERLLRRQTDQAGCDA